MTLPTTLRRLLPKPAAVAAFLVAALLLAVAGPTNNGAHASRYFTTTQCATPSPALSGRKVNVTPVDICIFGVVSTSVDAVDFANVSLGNATASGDCTAPYYDAQKLLLLVAGNLTNVGDVARAPPLNGSSAAHRTDAVIYFAWGLRQIVLNTTHAQYVPEFDSNTTAPGKCVRFNRIESRPAVRSTYYNVTTTPVPSVGSGTAAAFAPCAGRTAVREEAFPLNDTSAGAGLKGVDIFTGGVDCPAASTNISYIDIRNEPPAYSLDNLYATLWYTSCNASTQRTITPIAPLPMLCVKNSIRYADCAPTPLPCVTFGFFNDSACTIPADDAIDSTAEAPYTNAAPRTLDVLCSTNSTNTSAQFLGPFGAMAKCDAARGNYTLANDCGDEDFGCTYTDDLTAATPCVASIVFPGRYVKIVEGATTKRCRAVSIYQYAGDKCSGEVINSTTTAASACESDNFGYFCPDWNATGYTTPTFEVTFSNPNVTVAEAAAALANVTKRGSGNFSVAAYAGGPAGKFLVTVASIDVGAALNGVPLNDAKLRGMTSIATQTTLNYFSPLYFPFEFTIADIVGSTLTGVLFFFLPIAAYLGRKYDECGEEVHEEEEDTTLQDVPS